MISSCFPSTYPNPPTYALSRFPQPGNGTFARCVRSINSHARIIANERRPHNRSEDGFFVGVWPIGDGTASEVKTEGALAINGVISFHFAQYLLQNFRSVSVTERIRGQGHSHALSPEVLARLFRPIERVHGVFRTVVDTHLQSIQVGQLRVQQVRHVISTHGHDLGEELRVAKSNVEAKPTTGRESGQDNV